MSHPVVEVEARLAALDARKRDAEKCEHAGREAQAGARHLLRLSVRRTTAGFAQLTQCDTSSKGTRTRNLHLPPATHDAEKRYQ